MTELSDQISRSERKIICWECGGSGVMAKDSRAVPCEVCQNEYGEMVVVPKHELTAEELGAEIAREQRNEARAEVQGLRKTLRAWLAADDAAEADFTDATEAQLNAAIDAARDAVALDEGEETR